jgi:hypothetical protein
MMADKTDGNGAPMKALPGDQPPGALATEPTYPWDSPITNRYTYMYQIEDQRLEYVGDSVTVRITNVVTADNVLNQFLPFGIVENGDFGQLRIISVNKISGGDGSWNGHVANGFMYPVVPDSAQNAVVGSAITAQVPESFYSSVATDIWNFKVTLTAWSPQGRSRTHRLEIWKDGDEGNKASEDLQNNSVGPEAYHIYILVGNPEGMYNPYAQNLLHPTRATVLGVTWALAKNTPITNIHYGNDTLTIEASQYLENTTWVYPDPDAFAFADGGGGTYTWSLVAGDGDTDNALFGWGPPGMLSSAAPRNATYNIRIGVEDQFGHTFERAFVIQPSGS